LRRGDLDAQRPARRGVVDDEQPVRRCHRTIKRTPLIILKLKTAVEAYASSDRSAAKRGAFHETWGMSPEDARVLLNRQAEGFALTLPGASLRGCGG
jgi:hypothetical protein